MPLSPNTLRHNARERALQAIYHWQLNAMPASELIEEFIKTHSMKKVDVDYFSALVMGVVDAIETLDAHLKPCLDRDLDALQQTERAGLRLAAYELLHCLDVPYRVVINEAVDLIKAFGSQGGYKYVNGVLDQLAKVLRAGKDYQA